MHSDYFASNFQMRCQQEPLRRCYWQWSKKYFFAWPELSIVILLYCLGYFYSSLCRIQASPLRRYRLPRTKCNRLKFSFVPPRAVNLIHLHLMWNAALSPLHFHIFTHFSSLSFELWQQTQDSSEGIPRGLYGRVYFLFYHSSQHLLQAKWLDNLSH